MRIKALALLMVTCMAAAVALSSCETRKGEPGTASNPIRFYFMPLKGEKVFTQYAPLLEKFIEENVGLSVEMTHAKDFISIIEAFGKNKADIAFMNTLGYLMAHDWAGAEAHLKTLYGDVYNSYRGEILVRTDSGLNNVADLNGKTVAFADPFSASGYLYALKLFRDRNIRPSKTVFAGGHFRSVEMVYNGEVDVAATYHTKPTAAGLERDARAELIKKYPDIISKVKIVALTDEIPNGPVAFNKNLTQDVKSKLVGAIMEFARTPDGRVALQQLYNVTGFTLGNDSDYDGVRKVLKDLGKSAEEIVPGGVTFYRTHAEGWLLY